MDPFCQASKRRLPFSLDRSFIASADVVSRADKTGCSDKRRPSDRSRTSSRPGHSVGVCTDVTVQWTGNDG